MVAACLVARLWRLIISRENEILRQENEWWRGCEGSHGAQELSDREDGK